VLTLQALNPGPYTGPTGNNTYLLPGAVPALIDAGVGHAGHLDAIAEALGGRPLARVIVTHAHPDHASGATAIAERWPSAEFLKIPWPDHDARYPAPWRPVAEGDRIEAGDTWLTAVHTPGHAPDHLCLWDEERRALFSGDLVVRGTTVVVPGRERGGSVGQYLESLERVLALAPSVLFPAHGPAIEDVERLLRMYIRHRLERAEQILSLLREGRQTIDELVTIMYPALHPQLHGAARETVLAHLQKLLDDGRVDADERHAPGGDSHYRVR